MSAQIGIEGAVALAGNGAADMAHRWSRIYHTTGTPPEWLADETLSLARALVEDALGVNALVQRWQREHGNREQQRLAGEFFTAMHGVHRDLERLGLDGIDRLCERLAVSGQVMWDGQCQGRAQGG